MFATLLTDLTAVVVCAALCGAWVLVQQFVARRDPCQPGVEGGCGKCGGGECKTKRAERADSLRVL
jgi:hypothetical protein